MAPYHPLSANGRAKRKAWARTYYERKRGIKLCTNCRQEIPVGSGCKKYCPDCAIELHGSAKFAEVTFYARKYFSQLAEVNPTEAKKILSEIEAEEGSNFRNLLLDGIPEKVLKVTSGGEP